MISSIIEETGVAITARGTYYPPGKPVDPTVPKLYLVIEGETSQSVDAARKIIKETLITATAASIEEIERRGGSNKYSIV
jgi:ATP-dependent RNA helicase DDX46/PRP5